MLRFAFFVKEVWFAIKAIENVLDFAILYAVLSHCWKSRS